MVSSSNFTDYDPDPSWRKRKICDESDWPILFPKQSRVAAAQARDLCSMCPVAEQCRDYAVRNRIIQGIWGGMTYTERRPLIAEMDRVAAAERAASPDTLEDGITCREPSFEKYVAGCHCPGCRAENTKFRTQRKQKRRDRTGEKARLRAEKNTEKNTEQSAA